MACSEPVAVVGDWSSLRKIFIGRLSFIESKSASFLNGCKGLCSFLPGVLIRRLWTSCFPHASHSRDHVLQNAAHLLQLHPRGCCSGQQRLRSPASHAFRPLSRCTRQEHCKHLFEAALGPSPMRLSTRTRQPATAPLEQSRTGARSKA